MDLVQFEVCLKLGLDEGLFAGEVLYSLTTHLGVFLMTVSSMLTLLFEAYFCAFMISYYQDCTMYLPETCDY